MNVNIFVKVDIKSIEWGWSNKDEGQNLSKFCSAARDVVGGTNGYSDNR